MNRWQTATMAPAVVVAASVMITFEALFARLLSDIASQGQILLFRSGTQVVLVMLVCMATTGGIGVALRTHRVRLHALRGALSSVAWWLYFMSFKTLPLPLATTLTFSSQLFVLLLVWPVLRERVTAPQLVATLIGFAGVLVAAGAGNPSKLDWSVGYGLASAFMGALMLLMTRSLSLTDRTETILFYMGLAVFVSAIPQCLLDWTPLSERALVYLGVMALTGTLGSWMVVEAYRAAPPSALAPFGYARLLFAALAGYLVFDERIAKTTLIGAALIAASTLGLLWYTTWRAKMRA